MVKAMEPRGDPAHPRTAKEAHDHMVGLLDTALSDDRSAILITMKPLPAGMIDVKSGMMNLDQHDKGLLMVAFAVVQMSRRSGSKIKDDLFTLGEFVGRLLG